MQLKKYIKILIELIIILCIIITSNTTNKIESKYKVELKAQKEQERESFKEWLNEDYWEWHTRDTISDIAYNGRHIKLSEDIVFYGYGVTSYKDFLYKEYSNAGKKSFYFTVDEEKANYHTLDGAGFMFNAKIENNKLSGYILLYRQNDICIYRLDDVDVNKFETTENKTVADYGTLVKSVTKGSNDLHNLIINTTPTNINVIDNNIEILNLDLDYSKHAGESFGLISSYAQHNCSQLSTITFKYFELEIEDYKIPILTTDEQGNPLQGVKIQVKDEEGNVREGISNKQGTFYIEGLQEGIYTIQEVEVPKMYKLNNSVIKFKVTANGKAVDIQTNKEIDLILKNELLKIEIQNNIKDTNIAISGSKIGLYNKNGEPIIGTDGTQMIGVTDENGKVTFTQIEEGTYIFKQLEVSKKYIKNNTEYKCTIDKEGNVKFIENEGIIYNEAIEKLPSYLPQTGETLLGIILLSITIIGAIYYAIKSRRY